MMSRNDRQEALCRAYVQGIAAVAGVGTSVPTPDYGIDMSLRLIGRLGERLDDDGVQIDLQLRSTTRALVSADHVRYDLDVETHEFLRSIRPVPRILVVLILPEEDERWLSQSAEEMTLRRCALWYSLRGADPVAASSSIRLAIPRHQLFSLEALHGMMDRVALGGVP